MLLVYPRKHGTIWQIFLTLQVKWCTNNITIYYFLPSTMVFKSKVVLQSNAALHLSNYTDTVLSQYLNFEFLHLLFGYCVCLGHYWNDVTLAVQFLHGHKVKCLQSEQDKKYSLWLKSYKSVKSWYKINNSWMFNNDLVYWMNKHCHNSTICYYKIISFIIIQYLYLIFLRLTYNCWVSCFAHKPKRYISVTNSMNRNRHSSHQHIRHCDYLIEMCLLHLLV